MINPMKYFRVGFSELLALLAIVIATGAGFFTLNARTGNTCDRVCKSESNDAGVRTLHDEAVYANDAGLPVGYGVEVASTERPVTVLNMPETHIVGRVPGAPEDNQEQSAILEPHETAASPPDLCTPDPCQAQHRTKMVIEFHSGHTFGYACGPPGSAPNSRRRYMKANHFFVGATVTIVGEEPAHSLSSDL